MAIYAEGSFFTREQLASSKLNTMVNAINTHTHNGTLGVKINLVNSVEGVLPPTLGGTGATANANTANGVVVLDASANLPNTTTLTAATVTVSESLSAPEKLVIPLNQPTSLENGCIWLT